MIPKDIIVGVSSLLDQAKQLLSEGKVHHEKANSKFDHAQSIAKIRSAYGYSLAAGTLIMKSMKKM